MEIKIGVIFIVVDISTEYTSIAICSIDTRGAYLVACEIEYVRFAFVSGGWQRMVDDGGFMGRTRAQMKNDDGLDGRSHARYGVANAMLCPTLNLNHINWLIATFSEKFRNNIRSYL